MNEKIVVGSILVLALLTGCSKHAAEPAATPEKSAAAEPSVKHGTNGQILVTVASAARQLAGVRTESLKSASLPATLKAFGHVLDSSALSILVAELATAETASLASAAELARLEGLVAQNNASQRALETARAAAARDKAMVDSARLRLLATWGKAIAERNDLPVLVRSLSGLETLLVDLELPAGETMEGLPLSAQLLSLAEGQEAIQAQFLGPAPATDRQSQGRGFWFLAQQKGPRLAPGAAVTGFMSLPGAPKTGLELPRSAVVRHLGAAWVYVQRAEESFERVAVQPGEPLKDGWFIAEGGAGGLKAGEEVVVAGAQLLLSEELKGQESE